MKISLDWLNDYVETGLGAEQIAQILSDRGFPTEGIEHVDGDVVVDIEITSNRGDCLSYIGVAREVASATGCQLKMPSIDIPESENSAGDHVSVAISASDVCHRYTARVIEGIKLGASPEWMKKRLEAVGIRSVSNVVDATNYAMLETGQPPHAFDKDKLRGKNIEVRKAVKGERLVTIDGSKCDLEEYMLVIADEKGPIALAGVMGGLDTEVSDSTSNILLEDAHFDPVTVRTAGRKLAISSEASFRFERHVDTEMIDWASQRTAALIVQVAGGKVLSGIVDQYPQKEETEKVSMRFSRVGKLLGIEVAKEEIVKIFESLGFAPQLDGEDSITATVPTWRHDIKREVDLIEEVARCHGYDNIPTGDKINISITPVDKHQKVAAKLGSFLNGCGYFETINVTFVDQATAGLFNSIDEGVHLSVKDETRKSASLLRQNLMGSLLGVLQYNYNAKNTPCKIYELSNTFKPSEGPLPDERTMLSMVSDGAFSELRGAIDGLVKLLDKDAQVQIEPVEQLWAQAAGQVLVNGSKIGVCGVVSEKVRKHFGLSDILPCAAELDFQMLLEMAGKIPAVKLIPRFPAITRDLSLILDESVSWADIENIVRSKSSPELEEVEFVGIYRGKPIEKGKKSLTLSLRFRDEDGTLRHETVDEFESAILAGLTSELKAVLRTI